jgi:hypothetical protein
MRPAPDFRRSNEQIDDRRNEAGNGRCPERVRAGHLDIGADRSSLGRDRTAFLRGVDSVDAHDVRPARRNDWTRCLLSRAAAVPGP